MAKQKFKVVGPFVTHGVAPGGTFEADLDEAHVEQLVEQGALQVVRADAKVTDKPEIVQPPEQTPTEEGKS